MGGHRSVTPCSFVPSLGKNRKIVINHITQAFVISKAFREVVIEKRFLDQGVHTSWATLREQLSTHQVITVVLPTGRGKLLKIRKGSTPEPIHREIYRTLHIPHEAMRPVKTWVSATHSDATPP